MTARFVLLAMIIAVPASAQRVTLGANVGGSSANADLGSSTGWKSGWSAGANLTYRLTSRFGFRADANLAQNDLAGAATVPGEKRFNKAAFMADGVLQRAGHTEAAVDLVKLAGCRPIGVICEIMSDDGSMARLPELVDFAEKHGLKICTIEELIKYRRTREKLIERVEMSFTYEDVQFKTKVERRTAFARGLIWLQGEVVIHTHSSPVP